MKGFRFQVSGFGMAAVLFLSACSGGDGWFGGDEDKKPLPGKRISALEHREGLKSDSGISGVSVRLPGSESNSKWPLQQTEPVQHAAWNGSSTDTVSAVAGGSSSLRLTSTPVVADGIVYTLGAKGDISARKAGDPGDTVWEYRITSGETPDDVMGLGIVVGTTSKDFIGGNIAYGEGKLFAATRRGEVLALDASDGTLKWQRSVKLPVKSAPVVNDGRVYIGTNDNRLYALDADTGETLWIHAGIAETTSMFGAPSPAALENWVIVPYSSGELHALDAKTGRVVWSDVLATGVHHPSGVNLSGNSTPVISHGIVYATSYDGVLAAFELASGDRLWTQDVGGLFSPWLAGDFLFMLTSDNQLLCLHAPDGKVKWVADLPLHAEASSTSLSSKGARITWSGPVLAGGKLLLAGSHGQLAEFSPQDGQKVGEVEIPGGVQLPPVVANGMVYVLSNDGKLGIVR